MVKLKNARKITRDDYGDAWPLTIDEAWLRRCPETGAIRLQVMTGRMKWKTYALNGVASSFYGDRDIEPIHAPNLDIPPIPNDDGTGHRVRKSLAPLLRDAERLLPQR